MLSIDCFLRLFFTLGRLSSHFCIAYSPFRPINDFEIHFEWQKRTLTKAVSIHSATFSRIGHSATALFGKAT